LRRKASLDVARLFSHTNGDAEGAGSMQLREELWAYLRMTFQAMSLEGIGKEVSVDMKSSTDPGAHEYLEVKDTKRNQQK
jgi:hypothetical protein